jgi:hypothetical protein
MAPIAGAPEELCAACRRISDNLPAGIVPLRGDFAKEHKEEMIHAALVRQSSALSMARSKKVRGKRILRAGGLDAG